MLHEKSSVNTADRLILGLCVLQPVLSVLSYWMLELGGNMDVTLAIRFLMLAGTVCAAWVMTDRRGLLAGTAAVGAAVAPVGRTGSSVASGASVSSESSAGTGDTVCSSVTSGLSHTSGSVSGGSNTTAEDSS